MPVTTRQLLGVRAKGNGPSIRRLVRSAVALLSVSWVVNYPLSRANADQLSKDENAGCSGGVFGCDSDKVYGRACDEGFRRQSCTVEKVSGNGNCFAGRRHPTLDTTHFWVSPSNEQDCRCYAHAGASAGQGVQCRVTVTEQRIPKDKVVSLVARARNKKWFSNPLSTNCKSDYNVGFEVPAGTQLAGIGLSAGVCGAVPFDSPAGAHVGNNLGGARLAYRPPTLSGPGRYQAKVHWWVNVGATSDATVCVWVRGQDKQPLQYDSTDSEDKSNPTPHPFPFCVNSAGVTLDFPNDNGIPTGPPDINPDAPTVTWSSKEHPCFVMWPGCR
jgi:hypothetical protein